MTNRKYIHALSFSWMTPLYDALIEGPLSVTRLRHDLVAQMGNLGGKRVLDVGCGTGTLPVRVKASHPAAEVVGLDGDPAILEIARSKARRQALEIRFDQGMSYELPYPDESFDVVCTSMMLHHLTGDDKQRTASEMYRVLRPGGALFGADFAPPRSRFGKTLRPLTRRFERVAENVDGLLPIMFARAGFTDYTEGGRRYLFGSIALFRALRA